MRSKRIIDQIYIWRFAFILIISFITFGLIGVVKDIEAYFGWFLIGFILLSLPLSCVIIYLMEKYKYINKKERIYTEEFEQFYKELYEHNNSKIEKLRRQANSDMKKSTWILAGYFMFAICSLLLINFMPLKLYIGMNVMIWLIWFVWMAKLPGKSEKSTTLYVNEYRNNIIPKIIKAIDQNLDYHTNNEFGIYIKEHYKNANFEENCNYCRSKNYIVGKIEDINTQICELIVSESSKSLLFSGVFFSFINRKSIESEIKIIFETDLLKEDKTFILDHPDFEKKFAVQTDNNNLMLRILTHDVMNIILKYYKECNIPFDICIKNQNTYIRFYSENAFNYTVKEPALRKEKIYELYILLQCAKAIEFEINKIITSLEI